MKNKATDMSSKVTKINELLLEINMLHNIFERFHETDLAGNKETSEKIWTSIRFIANPGN